jgi:hypothetical protein
MWRGLLMPVSRISVDMGHSRRYWDVIVVILEMLLFAISRVVIALMTFLPMQEQFAN